MPLAASSPPRLRPTCFLLPAVSAAAPATAAALAAARLRSAEALAVHAAAAALHHAAAPVATAAAAARAAARAAAGPRCLRCQHRFFGSIGFLQKIAALGGSTQPLRSSGDLQTSREARGAFGTPLGVFDTMMAIEKKGREAVSSLVDREGRMQKKQHLLMQQFYAFYIKQLMAKEGIFALQDFLTLKSRLLEYLRHCEDELAGLKRKAGRKLGEMGLKRFNPEDSQEILNFKKEIGILECLTPSELRLTCPSGLSPLSRKTIAASAGVSLKDVEALLLQFSTMQADRHWFMRRLELRRPLPGSFEDRHLLAETDRPYEIRLPYGKTFYNYEIEAMRKLLKTRGDGRGDRRRAKNARKISIRCRLYHPKPRLWRDRWLFFPDFFADPYSNFAARRLYLQQRRRQQQREQQQQQQWRPLPPLPKGMDIKRKRWDLETLHAAFVKRLPKQDAELRALLQQASAAEEHKRLLLPQPKRHPSRSPSSSGEETLVL